MIEKELYFEDTIIKYWISGNRHNPLLVFTHGITMDHDLFRHQVSYFKDDYCVITWDVISHGKSKEYKDFTVENAARVLTCIIKKEGYEKAHFIGQSMGGIIAQFISIVNAEMVESLTLIGCGSIELKYYSSFNKMLIRLTPKIFKIYPRKTLAKMISRVSTHTELAYEYTYKMMREYSSSEIAALANEFMNGLQLEENCEYDIPMLIVNGRYDLLGSVIFYSRKWSEDRNAIIRKISKSSHNANYDNPQEFNDILGKFLEELSCSKYEKISGERMLI